MADDNIIKFNSNAIHDTQNYALYSCMDQYILYALARTVTMTKHMLQHKTFSFFSQKIGSYGTRKTCELFANYFLIYPQQTIARSNNKKKTQ